MTSEAPPLITSEYFKLINSLYSKYSQPDLYIGVNGAS